MKSAKPKGTRPRRQKVGRAAAATRESVKAATDVAESRAASEAVEPMRRSAEAAVSAGERAAGVTSELTRSSVGAWVESGAVVARGMEDFGKAWLRFAQRSIEDGVAAADAIMKARSLPEAVGLQQEFARNSLGNLVAEGVRVSELSVRVAREAMQPIRARLDAAAGQRS